MSHIPSNLTFSEMSKSNLPAAQKSAIRRWYDSVEASGGIAQRAKLHMAAAGNGLRQGGESLLVGGILGAIHVEKGLDMDIQGRAKVPLDAAAGVIGLAGGALLAHEEVGVDLRNAGAAALAIFGFRKTEALLAAKKRAAGQTPASDKVAGEYSTMADIGAEEDPIIAAARML